MNRYIVERKGYDVPERIEADRWDVVGNALVFCYFEKESGLPVQTHAFTDWLSVQDEAQKEPYV